MTEKSAAAYGLLSSFWRQYAPRRVLAVSAEDAGRFAALFGPGTAVSVMPNIKFDRVAENPATEDAATDLRRSAGLPDSALLVALASVREEEEELLLPAIRALLGQRVRGAPVALAVAPRHMHRVPAWAERLRKAAFPFVRRSSGLAFSPEGHPVGSLSGPPAGKDSAPPLCLWDTFGELRTLYAAADAAFVGGSLAPTGGQNFLEALAQGLRPVVGPHVENFRWVGEDIFSSGLAIRIAQADALPRALLETLEARPSPKRRGDRDSADATEGDRPFGRSCVRERFAAWLARRTGGSDRASAAVVAALRQYRPSRRKICLNPVPL
jgi:3-deoxy-D-manno-octulosonic-acid transferase